VQFDKYKQLQWKYSFVAEESYLAIREWKKQDEHIANFCDRVSRAGRGLVNYEFELMKTWMARRDAVEAKATVLSSLA
jgi:hypothetical protein